jgi:PAS domain S-box-containing protein
MRYRILLIDDESNIRLTLKHFLSQEGHEAETAVDYDDALPMISESDFDLIISDIILGGKSGIDVLREVNERNLSCPVIMITGAPDFKTATDALRLGAFDYITKPVKKDELLHVTGMALRHKSLIDEKEKYRLHLETIFGNINEGIITVDREGRVTDINSSVMKICGYSKEMIGLAVGTFPVFCDGKCHEMLKETITGRKSAEVYRHECRNRKSPAKVVSINTSPLIDKKGNFSGAMLVIRDETQLEDLERDLQERKQLHNIVGKSDMIQGVYSLIEDLADLPTTVLITGESGTGKELVAEALHYKGNRKDRPMIKVNCSALQDSLLESELFGHVKGAFTGAIENRDGRFKKADGGTIFLDEIGDISKNIQLKLLRVLQENEFERVGDATNTGKTCIIVLR